MGVTTWRVFVLYEGGHADDPGLSVVTDDDRQATLLYVDIPDGGDVDQLLAENGWRRAGDWEPTLDGRHAPVRRAGRGRPSRGVRVETKLTPGEVARVEELVGHWGADRSDVLAALVRRQLAALDGAES